MSAGGKADSICSLRTFPVLIRCRPRLPKSRCGAGTPFWGIGRAGNSPVYSEQFRSACKTHRPLYGKLTVRWTDSGRGRFNMRRREVIMLLGGAAAAWPLAARAQPDGVPRVALFMGIADDSEGRRRAAAFRQALLQLGWKEGSTVRIDERWGVADTDVIRASAIELLQLNPSVIVVQGARAVPILQQATKTIPIVFVSISDPVGRGIVTNMARPGGNITGFQLFEFSVIGKLLEALKEVAPKVSRVACLVNPDNPAANFHVRSFETVAPSLAVQPLIARVHNSADIARAIEAFA